MRFFGPGKFWTLGVPTLIVLCLVSFVAAKRYYRRAHLRDLAQNQKRFFTDDFPNSESLRNELHQLRMQARLTPENEKAVLATVQRTGELLSIPPGVLWCLLFQESRLDHMAGHNESSGAVGLGQFSKFSFYEVNHHLTRFTDRNLAPFTQILGQDVRPISPTLTKSLDVSSYYFIPTAVISSATYLNNRYLHLKTLLDKHQLSFDEDLLWIYATLAYNKGTRSVLSFWNTVHREKGIDTLQQSLIEYKALEKLVRNKKLVKHSFLKIWPAYQAEAYSSEWMIHFSNTSRCALANDKLQTANKTRQGES